MNPSDDSASGTEGGPDPIEARLVGWLRAAGDDPETLDAADRADLAAAADACLAGGREVSAWYRRHGEASIASRRKSAGDPVTAADRAADRSIHERLGALRPEDRVLSEESEPPSDLGPRGRLWVCDPLDGTREFLDRNGEFCVMVGLALDGAARLGALYRPDPGVLYLGLAAGGAWRVDLSVGPEALGVGSPESEGDRGSPAAPGSPVADGVPVRRLRAPRREARKGDPVRLVHSRSHPPAELGGLTDHLGPVEAVPHGSSGLKCALVAEDRADLYVHPVPYLKEWDTCAPEAVLRGAGGLVTDCDGKRLSYGKGDPRQPRGILAGGPGFHLRGLRALKHVLEP